MKGFNLVEVQAWNGLTFVGKNGVPFDGVDINSIPVFLIKYLDIELDIELDNTVKICQRCNNVHKINSLSEVNKLDKMLDLHLGAYPF